MEIEEWPRGCQNIFEIVSKHLLKQNAKCLTRDGDVCSYRNTTPGMACAFGAVIPDKDYITDIEGKTVVSLIEVRSNVFYNANLQVHTALLAFSKKIPYEDDGAEFKLLVELQRVHDRYNPNTWKERLREVGNGAGLDISFLNQ